MASGLWNRNASQARLKEWTDTQSVPIVSVIAPATGDNKSSLDLPGRLEAYARAPIYARVSGFLKAWYVDIGAPVKAGQLLAEIEAPDLDQQLLQAKAALASAQAGEALALVTAQRWQTLGGTNTVAKQTVDEKTGDLTVKQALSKAAKANVDRLEVLADFKRLMAPFDGIVTTRNTDVGALINADSSAGLALFVISDTQKLRVNVSIPQNYVPAVKINTKVQITVPEYPGKIYYGVVDASARAVDAAERHDAHAARGRQQRRRADAGRLRQHAHRAAADRAGAQHSGRRADLRPEGPARGDRRRQQQGRAEDHHHRPRPRARSSRSPTGIAATDRIIDSPPDGLADGDPVRVVDGNAKKAAAATQDKKS